MSENVPERRGASARLERAGAHGHGAVGDGGPTGGTAGTSATPAAADKAAESSVVLWTSDGSEHR